LPESVVVPVTPSVPPTVALPFDANVLNVPAAGVVPPIAILFIVPPVNVALDEEKLFAVVAPLKVVAPVTPRVPPKVVAPVPTENVLVPVTEVLPFSETAPVPVLNVPDPDCRKFPETPRVVNDPVDGVLPPIAILFIVPPVRVALDEEKLLAVVAPLRVVAPVTPRVPPKVVAPVPTENVLVPVTLVVPFNETVPVPVLNVPDPDCRKLPVAVRLVNFPVEAVVEPIGMLSIYPPVRVALDEEKLLAVVAPFRFVAPVNVFVLDPLCV
jgi:hypothetical protein